ncbi:MAG: serine hydrolase domain-containing protein [Bacteroides sp.]
MGSISHTYGKYQRPSWEGSPPGFGCQAFSKSVVAVQVRTVRPMCKPFRFSFQLFRNSCFNRLFPGFSWLSLQLPRIARTLYPQPSYPHSALILIFFILSLPSQPLKISIMKQLVFTFLICCFVQMGFSQESSLAKLDTYFETLDQHDKFMGAVCVSRAGDNLYTKSVGYASIEAKTKANPHTVYKIGSISKSFTAVLIFQAIDKGMLTLSTPLNKFFPTIKNAETITIDYLLSHRSGIHNFTDNDFPTWATETKTRSELLKIIEAGGSDFTPNSKAQYSNSNYVLLSYILEIIYNKPFAAILQTDIIAPLKLADTSFGSVKSNPVCSSYKYFDKWRIESDTDCSVTMGAGGIVSTVNDLTIFFHALFSGKLISENSLVQMKTMTEGYGKGLFRMPFGNKIGYGHSGGIDGFHSISIYFPDDEIAYSLISNATNCLVNNLSIAVLNATYNIPFEVPTFAVVQYTSADLDNYLGVYSSEQLPIKITITKRDKVLVGQGTGQPSFDLEASSENTFRFDPAGIVMVFDPDKATLVLKQGGGAFFMKKE